MARILMASVLFFAIGSIGAITGWVLGGGCFDTSDRCLFGRGAPAFHIANHGQ